MITIPVDVPVDPAPPEARDWLINELSKPAYQAAKPTFFDQVAKAIQDWINSLQFGDAEGTPVFGIGVIVVIVAAALVVAFLIFGLPRLNRRSAVAGVLFGDDDTRSAARMRQDAAAAASRGDYSTGVMELFRSIARGLAERTLVTTTPGTTARGFAARAGTVLPTVVARLLAAAVDFDDVRYLGRAGTQQQYDTLAALESDLRSLRPALESVSA